MKRLILTGILALATSSTILMAQQQKKGNAPAQPPQQGQQQQQGQQMVPGAKTPEPLPSFRMSTRIRTASGA